MKRFFRTALTCLLLLAALMECGRILARHFLQMPAAWLDETIIFPLIWLYMLGMANAAREDMQITAKILPLLFPDPRIKAICDFLARLSSMIISAWLAWHATDYLFYSIQAGRKTAFLFWPMTIGEGAVACGMLLTAFYCLVQFRTSARNIRKTFAHDC